MNFRPVRENNAPSLLSHIILAVFNLGTGYYLLWFWPAFFTLQIIKTNDS